MGRLAVSLKLFTNIVPPVWESNDLEGFHSIFLIRCTALASPVVAKPLDDPSKTWCRSGRIWIGCVPRLDLVEVIWVYGC
jgi:hypothetical protein